MNNEFCYETKLCLSMFNPYLPAKVLKLSSKVNIKLSTVKFKRLGWLSSLLVHTTFYLKFVFIYDFQHAHILQIPHLCLDLSFKNIVRP